MKVVNMLLLLKMVQRTAVEATRKSWQESDKAMCSASVQGAVLCVPSPLLLEQITSNYVWKRCILLVTKGEHTNHLMAWRAGCRKVKFTLLLMWRLGLDCHMQRKCMTSAWTMLHLFSAVQIGQIYNYFELREMPANVEKWSAIPDDDTEIVGHWE